MNAPYFCKTYVNESRHTSERAISLKLIHAPLKLGKVEMPVYWFKRCVRRNFLSYAYAVYTHMNESCRTYEQVTSHMDGSFDTYQHFAHTQHGVKNDSYSATYMNGSRHTWTSPVAHTWVSHVTHGWVMSHMNESCHKYRDLARTQPGCNNEWHHECHTYECVTCMNAWYVWMRDMYEGVTCMNVSHVWMCHMYECVTCMNVSHIWMRHTTHEWVSSHVWTSHATHGQVMSHIPASCAYAARRQ